MAGQGLALMSLFGNLMGNDSMQSPMGRPGGYQEDTYAMNVQRSKDGKQASVLFNTMDPTPMGSLMRENFRRLGIDNPYAGRRGVSLTAKAEGDKLIFDIGGKQKSVTEEALMNARGNQLQRLLGINSFMDFQRVNSNAVGNAATSKAGLQQVQPQATPDATRGGGATAGAGPVGPGTGTAAGAGAAGRPANAPVDTTNGQPLAAIPNLQNAPFAAMPFMANNPGMMQGMRPGLDGQMFQNPFMPYLQQPQGSMTPRGGMQFDFNSQFGMPPQQQQAQMPLMIPEGM